MVKGYEAEIGALSYCVINVSLILRAPHCSDNSSLVRSADAVSVHSFRVTLRLACFTVL